MKKFTYTLAALLFASVLMFSFGCSKDGSSANETVVIKTMAYGDNSNFEGTSWVRIVDTFEEENPGIKIDYEMLYDEPYHQKVVARLASGDTPDLAFMGADARWGAPWQEAGQQVDHTPFIDKEFYDISLIPPMGPNGEIYEIPRGTSNITTVLYANEKLINDLGFELPETYEDMVAMVPAARDAGLDVISIDGADGWAWGSCLMSSIVARMSGDPQWISKAVAGEKSFNDPEFIASLQMLKKMVDDGVLSSKSVLVDYGTNLSNFANEKALFVIQGQWAAADLGSDELKDQTAMMSFPAFPGEKSSTAGSVAAAVQTGYGLTKQGAENPAVRDAAMKFLKFFYQEAETTERLRSGLIVAPILKGYVVPDDMPHLVKEKVRLAQTAMNTEVLDAFLSGAPNDALNAGMQQIVSGQSSPEDIAAEVEGLLR